MPTTKIHYEPIGYTSLIKGLRIAWCGSWRLPYEQYQGSHCYRDVTCSRCLNKLTKLVGLSNNTPIEIIADKLEELGKELS